LVLAIFIVHQDHHLARLDVGDGVLDRADLPRPLWRRTEGREHSAFSYSAGPGGEEAARFSARRFLPVVRYSLSVVVPNGQRTTDNGKPLPGPALTPGRASFPSHRLRFGGPSDGLGRGAASAGGFAGAKGADPARALFLSARVQGQGTG